MSRLKRWIAGGFAAMLMLIVCVVLFSFDTTIFACKRTFLAPQWLMLLCGLFGIAALCMVLHGVYMMGRALHVGGGEHTFGRRAAAIEVLPWVIMLGIQWILCFHAYFLTNWDAQSVVESAFALASGKGSPDIWYLSIYDNNAPLVVIFSVGIRLFRMLLGDIGMSRCVYGLIAGQCLLNVVTGLMLCRIARRMTGLPMFSACAGMIYAVFVGLSPWLLIPYSDSMGLIFPTMITYVYQMQVQGMRRWFKWLGLGVLTGLGYWIKPQTAIVSIAIVLVELFRVLCCTKCRRGLVRGICALVVFASVAGPGKALLIRAAGIELRTGWTLDAVYFVMMGLNTQTNGIYSAEDVGMALSVADPDARREMEIEEIVRRLKELSPGELLEHLKKKTLTNYADGSFAWSLEGNFYRQWLEDKDDLLSPLLKDIIDVNGSRYGKMLSIMQSIWLAILVGCLFSGGWALIRSCDDVQAVMMLSLIGLTVFEWIFEARARYLYIYAPMYVLLGAWGIWQCVQKALGQSEKK